MSDVGGDAPGGFAPQGSPPAASGASISEESVEESASHGQRPRFGEYAVDERPRPEYGEYATPEEQRAAIKQPIDYGDGDEDAAKPSGDVRGFGALFGQSGDSRRPGRSGEAEQKGETAQTGQPNRVGESGYGVGRQPGVEAQPGQSGQPNQPGQAIGQWGQPWQGGDSGQPVQPVQPGQGAQPGQPWGSAQPGQPGTFGQPNGPGGPWLGGPGQGQYLPPYPQGQYPQGSNSQLRVRRPPGPFDRAIAMLFLAYGLWTVVTNCISAFSGGYAHVAESFSSWFAALGEKVPTIPDWLGIAIALVELVTWCVTAGITISRIQHRRRALWIPVFGVVAAGILTTVVLAIGFISDPTLMHSLVPTSSSSSGAS